MQHVRITTHGEKSVSPNGHGLGAWLSVIHGQDISVVEDQIRFLLFEREKRKRRKGAEEFAARSSTVHSHPLQEVRRNRAHATTAEPERQRTSYTGKTSELSRGCEEACKVHWRRQSRPRVRGRPAAREDRRGGGRTDRALPRGLPDW